MTEKNLHQTKLIVSIVFILLFICTPFMSSQNRTKSISITQTVNPPKIDGLIEDDCWKIIRPVSGFVQFDPVNGVKASEETFAWITYDLENLYFAFLMKDSQPDKIWAELTPRNTYEDNDSITVILDAYNDKRTSISFTVNPKGVQKNSIETIWKSNAAIHKDSWTAEMAIPFKSLRFSSEKKQIWGINFERYIYRFDEKDYWTDVNRDEPLLHQMGDLLGLSGVRPGYNIEFFPYLGFRSSRWDGAKDDKAAVGLDFKYGILPNLILDMTVSPDFSEVESDPFIYQLSPYETYFRENRPFFTEGSRYFNLSTESGFRTQNRMFYSRRISSPLFATKLSGKTGGYAFGILGALNQDEDEEKSSIYNVFRIQKDVFKNSQIGIYYSGRKASEEHGQNLAVDYNFNFKDIYHFRGHSAFSLNNNLENKNNGMHVMQFERESDVGLQLGFNFSRIEKNYTAKAGFISRTNVQTTEIGAGYSWRYTQGKIKHFTLNFGGNLEQDCSGNTTGQSLDLSGRFNFFSRMFMRWSLEAGKSKYQVYDENYDELSWTGNFTDSYGGNVGIHWYRGGFLKDINLSLSLQKRGIYNEDFTGVESGTQASLDGSLYFRPRSNIEWSVGCDWTRQVINRTGEKVFDGMAYSTSFHYQLTRHLFLNTRLKGETIGNQYNLDFVIGYYFGAGNIIRLVYKKSGITQDLIREGGHSIVLKVSYLLRI